MGKLTSGILGPVSGKVAGVVGGRWKDKQYLRGYAIPANPNTVAQAAQRTKMTSTVAFCKTLVGPIFNEYYDKFLPGMSGFNAFVKANIAEFDGSPVYANVVLGSGKLYFAGAAGSEYDNASGDAELYFSDALGNNGLATDKIFACIYDKSSGLWYFAAAEVLRSAAQITVPCAVGLTATNLEAYLLAAQYDASSILRVVSTAIWQDVAAA